MKTVKASEARRTWFTLLDEVADGEVVHLERNGRQLVLKREESAKGVSRASVPDYSKLIRFPDVDHADSWSWEWKPSEGKLRLRAARRKP